MEAYEFQATPKIIKAARKQRTLTQRVVRHLNRLPSEAVDAPSLEVLRVRLDGTLKQSGLEGGVPAYSRGVGIR